MELGEIGQSALWLTLVLAIYGVIAAGASSLGSARLRGVALLESARGAAFGVAALATLATVILLYAFVIHDFSLAYVAQHTSRDTPLAVAFTGVWGGQAGSLLFWTWGLTCLTACVLGREFDRHRELMPVVIGTMLGVLVFFCLVLITVSNPFETLSRPVPDGRGLNPLLWDIGMRVHPPLLLSGFMSFTAPFAFAVAVLVSGRVGRESLAAVRRWTLVAWTIQGAGLLAGGWWAYHVLGWGGYWGWDAVENVALLPWLTATAFLHSVMVQERRGMLKVWNVVLPLASFCLAIFGTFVVRSGVLSSVHSFAQSRLGPYFLVFLGVTSIASLALVSYRLPQLQGEEHYDGPLSREAGLLVNNFLLVAVAVATFWGTIFPLVAELTNGSKVSVGAPFYQQVNGPLFLGLLALMGVGPLLAWRRMSAVSLWRNVRWPLSTALGLSVVLLALGVRAGLAWLAFGTAFFTAATIGLEFWRGVRARRRGGESVGVALATLIGCNRRRYGGYIVHLAMVFIAFGVIASHAFQTEAVATLARGESAAAGRYALTYQGMTERRDPGFQTFSANLTVREGGRVLGAVSPARQIYRNWEQQPVSTVALQTTWPWLDDVYVLLNSWEDSGAATVRVFVNPLVSLIWFGGGLFLAGTLIAAWPATVRRRQVQLVWAREAVPHAV